MFIILTEVQAGHVRGVTGMVYDESADEFIKPDP